MTKRSKTPEAAPETHAHDVDVEGSGNGPRRNPAGLTIPSQHPENAEKSSPRRSQARPVYESGLFTCARKNKTNSLLLIKAPLALG